MQQNDIFSWSVSCTDKLDSIEKHPKDSAKYDWHVQVAHGQAFIRHLIREEALAWFSSKKLVEEIHTGTQLKAREMLSVCTPLYLAVCARGSLFR